MNRYPAEAVSRVRRRIGIAIAMLMIGSLGVLGCGKPQPAGAAAARSPHPAPASATPVAPVARRPSAPPPPTKTPAEIRATPVAAAAPNQTAQIPAGAESARIPFRGVRRKIAQRLRESVDTAVHFTVMDEADVTDLDAPNWSPPRRPGG